MGEIRVVLIFNEDNERQKEIGRYLKSQKRCKTALITELVYAWLHKESAPREFEEVVEEVFKRQGFQTRLTPQTRDGGKDIIATKSILGRPVMFLIECKRYNEMNKIGVDIVRALYGVQTAERANKAIIVTSSYFTEDAQRFAEQQKTLIDLFDIDDLIELMENSIQNEQGNF